MRAALGKCSGIKGYIESGGVPREARPTPARQLDPLPPGRENSFRLRTRPAPPPRQSRARSPPHVQAVRPMPASPNPARALASLDAAERTRHERDPWWCGAGERGPESRTARPTVPASRAESRIRAGIHAIKGDRRFLRRVLVTCFAIRGGGPRSSMRESARRRSCNRLILRARGARGPRCGARTRAGGRCKAPAVHGRRRCRMHGGLSPGCAPWQPQCLASWWTLS